MSRDCYLERRYTSPNSLVREERFEFVDLFLARHFYHLLIRYQLCRANFSDI